jgi:hypothetical protein
MWQVLLLLFVRHYGNFEIELALKKKSLAIIIWYAFLKYWIGLQKESNKQIIIEGEAALHAMTLQAQMRASANHMLQITNLMECDDDA